MNDPLIARFADACGSTAPLDLRVDLVGGGVLAEGSVDQPFTLVGRDDACDVTLSDSEINPRHTWLQVLGGRVFAIDLGSRTGMTWPGGERGSGWLDPGVPAKIGPFLLRLRAQVAERPSNYPAGYSPLAADTGAKTRPVVALEFRNGRRAKDRWQVNRLITLIGRAPDCKIHLTADDISPYHCGLVSTPHGLWVVDLSGRGVVVNGERMRVATLQQGAELWVGRFLIGCQYQVPPAFGKSGRLVSRPASNDPAPAPPHPVAPADARVTTVAAPQPPVATEDEVELGAVPDTEDGLPGSHIMADAFRLWGSNPSGGMSNPILVSGSGPKPSPLPPELDALGQPDESPILGSSEDRSVVPALRQLADLHGRTATDFQQSLTLVARVFARAKRDHLAVLLQELTRIHELTAEIAALQREVARLTLETAADARARTSSDTKTPEPRAAGRVPPSSKTPFPDAHLQPRAESSSPLTPRPSDRLAALQHERAACWQALIALVSPSST